MAGAGPPGDRKRHCPRPTSIDPGEEKIYEWTAEYAGVFMQHCGTTPTLHDITNGMYGMVIVEPAEGPGPVEHEYALVQSEWYLGDQGQITDLGKASQAAADPDFVVFNGVASQYVDAPIEVPTGEGVRVFVLNAGPSVDSSFHIVGTIFDRVIKEGVELKVGNEGNWGAQAMAACTRSSPTPSTASVAERWASFRPVTATRRTDQSTGSRRATEPPGAVGHRGRSRVNASQAGGPARDRSHHPVGRSDQSMVRTGRDAATSDHRCLLGDLDPARRGALRGPQER